MDWFAHHKRDLPWRRDVSAYHTLVSETMLQQTRVEAVLTAYTRFLRCLPTVAALADCEENALYKLWEGLGYYRRAKNLQRAAQMIVTDFGGEIPRKVSDLLRLPGVGAYTAGAIASIAYGLRVPAVDGNVLRVMARLEADYADIALPQTKQLLTDHLQNVMPAQNAGDFNQALMDFGACVCLPNGAPLCRTCPVADYCLAFAQNAVGQLPVKSPKKTRRIEERRVFLLLFEDKVALRKRPNSGLLAGLWEFPNTTDDSEAFLASLGVKPETCRPIVPCGEAKHIFTHLEWHMTGTALTLREQPNQKSLCWVDAALLVKDYAMPSAFAHYRSYFLDKP